MTHVREYLEAESRLMSSVGHKRMKCWNGYASMGDFVLKNGTDFTATPLQETSLRGKMKECFKNAANIALFESDYIYCEGYALGVIPVHHAWVIHNGQAIEVTWKEPGSEYFGVPISESYLRKRILETECWHSLIDDWQNKWPMLSTPRAEWIHEAYDNPQPAKV